MTELLPWVQDAIAAEHSVRNCTEELAGSSSLTKDAEASSLVQRINDRAEKHIERIEELLSRLDEQPFGLRQAVGEGLGAVLGWMEKLPTRDLIQVVRDVYVALITPPPGTTFSTPARCYSGGRMPPVWRSNISATIRRPFDN